MHTVTPDPKEDSSDVYSYLFASVAWSPRLILDQAFCPLFPHADPGRRAVFSRRDLCPSAPSPNRADSHGR